MLFLYTAGDVMPRTGRHPIYFSWQHDGVVGEGRWFHACFIAGTPERPMGVFHGESGWVAITAVEWLTVHGMFSAEGDTTVASLSGSR